MKRVWVFDRGDLVRIKTGIFAGREGEVIEVLYAMSFDSWQEDFCQLTVQTRSFDGSKVAFHLDSENVEIIDASKTDG